MAIMSCGMFWWVTDSCLVDKNGYVMPDYKQMDYDTIITINGRN